MVVKRTVNRSRGTVSIFRVEAGIAVVGVVGQFRFQERVPCLRPGRPEAVPYSPTVQ